MERGRVSPATEASLPTEKEENSIEERYLKILSVSRLRYRVSSTDLQYAPISFHILFYLRQIHSYYLNLLT